MIKYSDDLMIAECVGDIRKLYSELQSRSQREIKKDSVGGLLVLVRFFKDRIKIIDLEIFRFDSYLANVNGENIFKYVAKDSDTVLGVS